MWAFTQSLEKQGIEAHISEMELSGGLVVSAKCNETGDVLQEMMIGYRFLMVEDRLRVLPPACPETGAVPMHDPAMYHINKLANKLRQGQAIQRARAA
jgi:hypothetical protein